MACFSWSDKMEKMYWLVTLVSHLSSISMNLWQSEIHWVSVYERMRIQSMFLLVNEHCKRVTRANLILLHWTFPVSLVPSYMYIYVHIWCVLHLQFVQTRSFVPLFRLNTPFFPPAGVSDHLQTSAGTLWRGATTLEKIHMDANDTSSRTSLINLWRFIFNFKRLLLAALVSF